MTLLADDLLLETWARALSDRLGGRGARFASMVLGASQTSDGLRVTLSLEPALPAVVLVDGRMEAPQDEAWPAGEAGALVGDAGPFAAVPRVLFGRWKGEQALADMADLGHVDSVDSFSWALESPESSLAELWAMDPAHHARYRARLLEGALADAPARAAERL